MTRDHWQKTRKRLKEIYADLADEDLIYVEGEEEQLIERLSIRLGKTREEMKMELNAV